MLDTGECLILDVDFQKFEKLLIQISQLANIFIEIKNLKGETMVRVPNNYIGALCRNQEAVPAKCHAESFNLSQQIQKSGEPVVQQCDDNDIIGLPLICNQRIFAILFACKSTDNGKISNDVIGLLDEIANIISHEIESHIEIDNIALELSDKYEKLSLLYDIGKTLGGISTTSETISYIVNQSKEIFYSSLVMASIPGSKIQEISDCGPDDLPFHVTDKVFTEKINRLFIERFSSHDQYSANIVLNNLQDDMQLADMFNVPVGILAVPVKLKGHISGFLCIFNFDPERPFQTGDVKMATSLAEQISMTITNAALYQNLKDFLINVIKTLVSSIEAKDTYTKGHSERVNALTMLMASNMELPPDELEEINWASMLHDIGKIGVPEDILSKPGRLTEAEFMKIKEHSEQGYRILAPIEQLKGALHGIRHHHERYDGAGYPLGLKGEDIPLHARIIAVADIYDAMTSTRSYRAKMSHEDAMTELLRVKGTQLDPKIVTVFVNQIYKLNGFRAK